MAALLEQAAARLQAGDMEQAQKLYAVALQSHPDDPQALLHAGLAAQRSGDRHSARTYLEQAAAIAPDWAELHFHRGNLLRELGEIEAASAAYQRAISLAPAAPGPLINLAGLLIESGQASQAEPLARQAIAVAPQASAAWGNLAGALAERGDLADSLAAAQRAIELDRGNAQAQVALGKVFSIQQRWPGARRAFEAALAADPDNRHALTGLGNLLDQADDLPRAIELLRRAVDLNPSDMGVLSTLVAKLQVACDWESFDRYARALDALPLGDGPVPAESPLLSVARSADPLRNLAVARAWSNQIGARMAGLGGWDFAAQRAQPNPRLRIGYLSCDLHDHATGHLMRSLFGLHDRKRFEIFAYSYGPDDGSVYRRDIAQSCDRFVDVQELGHGEAAECIHRDRIDILVDLKGHTRHNRLEICACRPAPVQATYLGYPGTTGADFLDYVITDRVVSPPEDAEFYSETFAYLPHSYQVNDADQPLNEVPTTRAEWGLPEDALVLCSFNQSFKIDRATFDLWMGLLKKIGSSVLWLLRDTDLAEANVRQAAEAAGISSDHLIFAEKVPKPRHLARLALADLALDTLICNGHTTTSDALWAGVPVVTCRGSHFASRVSESLLSAVGLPELVAGTPEELAQLALRLAGDAAELAKLKAHIASARHKAPLYDTTSTARALESLYQGMWRAFMDNRSPDTLEGESEA